MPVLKLTKVSMYDFYGVQRYLKKSRLLKFCHMPAASAASSTGIFAAAANSINQTNKAGSMRH